MMIMRKPLQTRENRYNWSAKLEPRSGNSEALNHTTGQEVMMASSKPTDTPCLIWQKAKNTRGYGVVKIDGKLQVAHRVAWFKAHGRWPDPTLVLDHICNVKACVNPEHLREIENWRNIRRAVPTGDAATETKRRLWRAAQARRRTYSANYVLDGRD